MPIIKKRHIKKTSSVVLDKMTKEVSYDYDLPFDGKNIFHIRNIPKFPKNFRMGLIVGASGSGKSLVLRKFFGKTKSIKWDKTKSIVSHFSSKSDAEKKLFAVGLNSIKTWLRPYHVLSNGEKFRASLARQLKSNMIIDEFTSVIDRTVAKSACNSINKYIAKNNLKRNVFVTCHYDIIEWLQPSWVYDMSTNELYSGRWLQKPKIEIRIYEGDHSSWKIFREHHYLSGDILKSSKVFLAFLGDILVGLIATCPLPSGTVFHAWREHRIVVLPDYQGFGIGIRLSEKIAEMYTSKGNRYFAKTSHRKLGVYRNQSDKWTGTSSNMSTHSAPNKFFKHWKTSDGRLCFSHEFIFKKVIRNESKQKKFL